MFRRVRQSTFPTRFAPNRKHRIVFGCWPNRVPNEGGSSTSSRMDEINDGFSERPMQIVRVLLCALKEVIETHDFRCIRFGSAAFVSK